MCNFFSFFYVFAWEGLRGIKYLLPKCEDIFLKFFLTFNSVVLKQKLQQIIEIIIINDISSNGVYDFLKITILLLFLLFRNRR